MIRGIDVSHYQKTVDWAGLKADHGLSFGAAKCSEGLSFVDSYFARNWAAMEKAGLARIAYHYATPSASTARAQAAKFVALVDPQPGDALCLDLEKSSLTQAQTNAWMRAFGDALHDLAPGITTIAYLGGYAANGSGQLAVDHFDHWWYPRYATTGPAGSWPSPSTHLPTPSPNTTGFVAPRCPSLWQWTPNLDGMDANVSNLSIAELFGTPTPVVDPATKDEPMFLVSLKSSAAQYVSDGQSRRGVVDTPYRDFLVARGCDPNVYEFDTVSGMNAAAGPLAATSPDYDGTKWVYPTPPAQPPTLDQITAAFLAALPEPSAGGLTADQVKQAVKDALKEGTS